MNDINRLRTLAIQIEADAADGDDIEDANCCRRAADLIGKLPVTADGVPVVPGMTITIDTGFGLQEFEALQRVDFDGTTPVIELQYRDDSGALRVTSFPATRCYSTRAAAEAAKGGEA